MAYLKTNYINEQNPPLNDENLNKSEEALINATLWKEATCLIDADYTLEIDNWETVENSFLAIYFSDVENIEKTAYLSINNEDKKLLVDNDGNQLKGKEIQNKMVILRYDGEKYVGISLNNEPVTSSSDDAIDITTVFPNVNPVNFNDIDKSGRYSCKSNITYENAPLGVNWILDVIATTDNPLLVRQVAYRIGTINSNDHQVFTRTRGSANTWSDWNPINMGATQEVIWTGTWEAGQTITPSIPFNKFQFLIIGMETQGTRIICPKLGFSFIRGSGALGSNTGITFYQVNANYDQATGKATLVQCNSMAHNASGSHAGVITRIPSEIIGVR